MKKLIALVVFLGLQPAAAQMHGQPSSPAATPTIAASFKVGDIVIEQPWLRGSPAGARVGGGYMKITNTGTAPDRLVGGSIEFARRFEVHEMAVADGIMTMRPLDQGLELKPGQTVELRPGGFHIMAMDLTDRYVPERRVKGTLQFEKAGSLAIEYVVLPIGATMR